MYNLLNEKWIPVLYRNGRFGRIGILQALQESGDINPAYNNPLDNFALFRFFLALGYWCLDNTGFPLKDGQDAPPEWLVFLQGQVDIFDLFDPKRPFWQDPKANRLRPVADLIHEIPAATNFWHFRHATDFIDGICPACCARGLLRLPLFTTIGGAGIGAGINGTPPFYVAPWGNTLREQLWLNWEPTDNPGDPAWVEPVQLVAGTEPSLLEGLTWQPRRVLLQVPTGEKNTCMVCGARDVDIVYYAHLQTNSAPKGFSWHDPHVVPGDTGKLLTSSVALMSSDKVAFTGRDWSKILAGYLRATPVPASRKIHVVGFSTNQAKYIDAWEKTVELPESGIHDDSIAKMSNWSRSLLRARKRKKNKDSAFKDIPTFADVIPHADSVLADRTGELAGNCEYNWEEAAKSFVPLFKISARSLYPDISVKAQLERQRLGLKKPLPFADDGKSAKKKKEGDQDE